jgi:hypothetical protein
MQMKMRMSDQWKRTAYTTRGADPTEVVEWSNGIYSIQEFQNVYRVFTCMGGHNCDDMRALGKKFHTQLERRWSEQREM